MRLWPNTKQAEKDLRNCNLPSFHLVVSWVGFVSIKFSLSFSFHLSGGLGRVSLHSSSSALDSNPLSKSKQTQGAGSRSETASGSPEPALCLQLHPQRQDSPQPGRRGNRAALYATGTALGSAPLFPSFPAWTITVFPKPFAQSPGASYSSPEDFFQKHLPEHSHRQARSASAVSLQPKEENSLD